MSFKPLNLILLASAALVTGLLGYRYAGPGMPVIPGADPLSQYATRKHSAAYEGIDRWAYYGMPADALTARLRHGRLQLYPAASARRRRTGLHPARSVAAGADPDHSRQGR